MSQIWCNSPKLMTALLGMGREGMISVWSSIWSVPSAGCREMLHYMLVCCLWRAHMHTHTDTPFARVISGSQCSCLCLGTDDFFFFFFCLTNTSHIVLKTWCCEMLHQNQHPFLGHWEIPLVMWLSTSHFLYHAVYYFKRKWANRHPI